MSKNEEKQKNLQNDFMPSEVGLIEIIDNKKETCCKQIRGFITETK